MPNYRFDEVTTRRRKGGRCPGCGRTVYRARSFTHTINPFNRNEDGTIKSREQVRADVHAEADAWKPDFRHATCVV